MVWDRFSDRQDVQNVTAQVFLLAGFGAVERLRRTILDLGVILRNPASADVDPLTQFGMWFAVEVTNSSTTPPTLNPFNMASKELLHLEQQNGGLISGNNSGIFYIAYPPDRRSVHIDTNVQRTGANGAFWVWGHWAAMFTPAGNTNVRWWYHYSLLREVV